MKTLNCRGVTLTELLVVAAILSVFAVGFTRIFSKSIANMQRIRVRQKVMVDSRTCMDAITQIMHNGKANSLVISTSPADPWPYPMADGTKIPIIPNSRVDFNLQSPLSSGTTAYAIFVAGHVAYAQEYKPPNGIQAPRVLATNVTSLMFTGSAKDPAIVNVSLRVDAPWDNSHDPTHVSTIILPNQVVHMSEQP